MPPAFENCDYLERHAFYNWVQDARCVVIDDKLTPVGKYFAEFQSKPGFKRSREVPHLWKIIQRRLNNGNWEVVKEVIFDKDYRAGKTVTVLDPFTTAGTVYYRVKATSYKDTESIFSRIVSVKVEQSGIDAVADDAADLFIRGEGSNLVIDATADAIYPVYTLDGRFVRNVEVTVGHNVYSDLAAGFYLVNKNKVVIR